MSEKLDISFDAISEALHGFDFPEVDLVLGIARGGTPPACMIAHQLGAALKIVRISHRNDANEPLYQEPVVVSDFDWDLFSHHRILIVDDVSVTGKTMAAVKERLSGHEVHTFVLKGTADYVLFPKVKSCVAWPWKNTIDA
ncbi:hypothetical protein SAMN05192553_101416 [Cyclobacterium xiamenense]|jgi:hypothetical protein|uniref:Phosphoribosyltransferase domain-containing protein n=1 Tax=Cyclobacterium xiamenense TaxID=1297121 RepID=A0A1H6TXN3_9BACT|nr:phosphoribosyltransferase [Cyclobacterium xiamenense]SEI82007.1 hypothetical protein SAMN05192553_101416 [Cyclobacterium xiamenense]